MAVCVRLFLERRESMVAAFSNEFQHLTLADEKNDLLNKFLETLALEMERDPVWQGNFCLLYNNSFNFYQVRRNCYIYIYCYQCILLMCSSSDTHIKDA